jgi:hypothetical protein
MAEISVSADNKPFGSPILLLQAEVLAAENDRLRALNRKPVIALIVVICAGTVEWLANLVK